jgi:glycosyltransferase involved in cell wall biosynthesis
MNSRPVFLMILNDLGWFWSHRLPLARAIKNSGWNLHLATAGATADPKLQEMNITPHDVPRHGNSLNPLSHLMIVWEIARIIRVTRPDLIHAITLRYAFYAGLAARMTRTHGIVFTIAGLGTLFTHNDLRSRIIRACMIPVLRFAFARDDARIIFQNPDDRRAFLNLNIVREDQTSVIRGSGVDMAEFPFVPEPAETSPRVLFPSRLLREKGIHDFVAAARIIKSRHIPARFQVAGDIYPGNPHSVSMDEIKAWEGEGIIEYLGVRRDMPRVMAESALVVLPSYYGEGVPKVLLEAAATGRAIITCDMPGCREAVCHEKNGLLVPPRSPEALAEAMQKLLINAERRHELGKAGRAHVESDFTAEIVTQKTLSVYGELKKR